MANPGTPPNLAPHSPTFLAASSPSHLIFFLENCGKILRRFCFHVDVNAALEMAFNWVGEGKTPRTILIYCMCPARDGHLGKDTASSQGSLLIAFKLHFNRTDHLGKCKKKKILVCSDQKCMGNTANLLSLQVEGLLPSCLVPNAGSLLPASAPQTSWPTPEQLTDGLSSVSLRCDLAKWNMSGWKGTRVPASVWTTCGHLPWKSNQILAEGWSHSSNSLPVFFFMLFVLFARSSDFMVLVESEVKKYHRRKWSKLVVFPTEPNPGNLGNSHCQPEVVRFPAR